MRGVPVVGKQLGDLGRLVQAGLARQNHHLRLVILVENLLVSALNQQAATVLKNFVMTVGPRISGEWVLSCVFKMMDLGRDGLIAHNRLHSEVTAELPGVS